MVDVIPGDGSPGPEGDAETKCALFRAEIPHVLLGQASAEFAAACREHILACGSCRVEWDATEVVLRGVRADSARAPSAGFHGRLVARLDQERRDEDARHVATAGLAGRIRMGAAFIRYRVEESTPLKVVVAIAAMYLVAIGAWWYVDRVDPVERATREVAASPTGGGAGVDLVGVDPSVTPSADATATSAPTRTADGEPDPLDYIEPPADPTPLEVAESEAEVFQPGFERELEEALLRENLFARARHQMRLRLSLDGRGAVAAGTGEGLASRTRSEADKAALRGMRFLIESQEEDGSWDPAAFGGEGYARVGVTGLCLAALSVDAGIPNELQAQALRNGHAFLRRTLDRRTMTFGGVIRGLSEAKDVTLFNHALATLALSEEYVLDGRSDRSAIPEIGSVQEVLAEALVRLDDLGRQRFDRELDQEDTTTAPWVALALETARAAGVRTEVVNLARAAETARQFVANQVPETDPDDAHLWAVVTVSGIDPLFDGELSEGVWLPPLDRLLPHLLTPALREPTKIFFASLDFHQRGGADWKRWRDAAELVMMREQREDGSWHSEFTWDRVQSAGGDLYATALSVMTLSVTYRHAR